MATRRTVPASVLEWAPPQELAGGLAVVQPSTGGNSSGKRFAHGLYVQVAYAAIDATFVCLGGIAIFLLRFSLFHRMAITSKLFRSASAHAHLAFFFLYPAPFVLSRITPNPPPPPPTPTPPHNT